MRKVALVLALVSGSVALFAGLSVEAAPDTVNRSFWQKNPPIGAPIAPLLTFAMSDGGSLGFPQNVDLCDAIDAGDLAGEWHCLKGDGGVTEGSVAFTNNGPMATQTFAACPNGTDCSSVVRLNDTTAASYFSRATTTAPTGDFTACTVFMGDPLISGSSIASKYNGATGGAYDMEVAGTSAFYFYVTGSATPFTTKAIVLGTENLHCMRYTHSTTTGVPWTNGATDSSVAVTGGIDATSRVHAVNAYATGGGKNLGRYRGSFFTEKVLSAADLGRIFDTTIGQPLTTSNGSRITFTRNSGASCIKEDESGGQLLRVDQPCVSGNGIGIFRTVLNSLLRSDALANAAWVAIGTPAAVSRAFTSPWGNTDLSSLTDNDGAASEGVYQDVALSAQLKYSFSCYARSSTASSMTLSLVGTGNSAGDVSCNFTGLTSTPTRKSCTSSAAYGSGLTSIRASILVGTATSDQGVIGVGNCQLETNSPKPYIRTDGTSVTRAVDSASVSVDTKSGVRDFKATYVTPAAFTTGATAHRVLKARIDANNYFEATVDNAATLTCLWQVGGVAKSGTAATTLTVNTSNDVQCKYDGVNITACVGGSCTDTPISFSPPTGTATVYFGGSETSGQEANGFIKNVCLSHVAGKC